MTVSLKDPNVALHVHVQGSNPWYSTVSMSAKDALFCSLALRVICRTSLFGIRHINCEFDILTLRVGIDRVSSPTILSLARLSVSLVAIRNLICPVPLQWLPPR